MFNAQEITRLKKKFLLIDTLVIFSLILWNYEKCQSLFSIKVDRIHNATINLHVIVYCKYLNYAILVQILVLQNMLSV